MHVHSHSEVHSTCAGLNPFHRISVSAFAQLFIYSNPEVSANKRQRFVKYLNNVADGTLLQRPNVRPRYVAHLEYHPPMWGVLQSSYEDVEAELNVLRNRHLDKKILFVGGDGLSIMRLNHLLLKHPDLYIDSAPMVIPVQGEAPHGVFHVMHAGWRLFVKFIRRAADATLGLELGKAVVDEPTVKVFNKQIFALWWMTRACSEYLLMLLRSPNAPDVTLVPEFLKECEKNVDLGWVAHFLYDFAFLVADVKQSVRANNSSKLDLIWREFLSVGMTGSANKTNYVPMAIMRVFWSQALVPDLANLYHELRAIPMSDRVFVGWDTPIEWLNGAITDGVRALVSEDRIEEFVANYSFLHHNYSAMREMVEAASPAGVSFMRDMDGNVARMKDWLIKNIGSDWNTASRPNRNSKLGISGRGKPPWDEIRDAMTKTGADSVASHVSEVVRGMTDSFYRFRP